MPKPSLPILISREQIRDRIHQLGEQIAAGYPDGDIHLVGVLNGSAVFLSDLIRAIPRAVRIDFVRAVSYGDGTETSGEVRLIKDLETDITGARVLLVEDIVDTGITLHHLLEHIGAKRPASLEVAALLDKPERHRWPVRIDYLGFTIPNQFVVGYGMDHAGNYRDLPDICLLDGSG